MGLITHIISDPGSDYTSRLVAKVNTFLYINHRVGMVDRPEGNAIERDVAEVKRFLRAIANHNDLRTEWSKPRVMMLAEFVINHDVHKPTDISPYMMEFGREDKQLANLIDKVETATGQIKDGDKQSYYDSFQREVEAVREIYLQHRNDIIKARTASNAHKPQNLFQPGDLVFQHIEKKKRSNTFAPLKLGPYQVIKHRENTVTLRNLVNGRIHDVHVTKCSLFDGQLDDAHRLAKQDNAESDFTGISGWRGNPENRQTLTFKVDYTDGTSQWQSFWHSDIQETVQLDEYCKNIPCLQHLTKTKDQETALLRELALLRIPDKQGDEVLLDLRFLSHTLYQFKAMDLPDKYNTTYLLRSKLTKVGTDKRQRALIQYGKNAVQIASKDYHRYVYNKHNLPRGKHKILDDSTLSETPFILEGDLPADYQTLTDVQLSEILDPLD